jgi:hypothetical protein
VLLGGFSLFSVLLGATLACVANRYPPHTQLVELIAGGLLIGGFGLLGADLASILGPPMR